MTKINNAAFIFSLLLQLHTAFAENFSAPGLIESYEKLLGLDELQSSKAVGLLTGKKSPGPPTGEMRLNSYFLRSIFINSETRYVSLAEQGECTFLSLLENGLLKWSNLPANSVLIDEKKSESEIISSIISLPVFLQTNYRTKCTSNREQNELFSEKNLTATIKNLSLKIPRSETECHNIFAQWRANNSLPHLCRLHELIQNGQKAEKIINGLDEKEMEKRRSLEKSIREKNLIENAVPLFERSYISNLCKNLNNEKEYCETYIGQDTWNKVINGELPSYTMSFLCQDILKKSEITNKDFILCAAKMKNTPKLCHAINLKERTTLFPRPNCQEVALALNSGHLKTDYRDCPSSIDTEGITNIFRLQRHFAPDSALFPNNDCHSDPYFSYAKMVIDFAGDTDNWPLKICYTDPVLRKEKCVAYIPGNNLKEKMAEGVVVGKILERLRGVPDKTTCKIIDVNDFKPSLLQYQTGCFIVRDTNNCATDGCERKIYYDKNLISGISFRGAFFYEYFANSYISEKFSSQNILAETYRLQNKVLKNLTELNFFLEQNKKGVAHAVGCVEDLLPQYFSRSALNQCRPIPFIIDGVVKKNNNNFLSVRSSVDDLHLPRLISWGFVFSALSNYRELHPLQKWTLYGLK